ncbi:ComEA family DNA-binding protein [Paenibacillus agaridevorans]|uniref:ComEA family DNA-binding protein n=1 Tax=Paenibacillus agaridevorans TaxID=171404 RepID=UPI001BE41115|nr:ComEA family DNA-binding protein [Paenibacillus agaridevorans]
MTGFLRNGRTIFVAACLLGAGLLSAAALLGESSRAEEKWIPMNEMMESSLSGMGDEHGAGVTANNEKNPAEQGGKDGDAVSGGSNGIAEAPGAEKKGNDNNGDSVSEAEGAADTGGSSSEASAGEVKSGVGGATNAGTLGQSAFASDGRLDINRADAGQLDGLKGIGPSKAQAIVDDREQNGPFRSVDDLLRVKGIGEKLLASIKESVVALP